MIVTLLGILLACSQEDSKSIDPDQANQSPEEHSGRDSAVPNEPENSPEAQPDSGVQYCPDAFDRAFRC